jgi:peptide/nickel transport system substrate-binding protein
MKNFLLHIGCLLLLPLMPPDAGSWAFAADENCPATGDNIVIASIGDAASMIPMLTSDSASHEISSYLYNGLLKYDKDLNLVGDLAESWEMSEDNLSITFHIRRGIRYHDGTPYTAHDSLFNWQFMVDPQTPTGYAADYLQVEKAQVLDDYTFRVTYGQPYSHALASWTLPQMPRHLLAGTEPRASSLNRRPVGTGAFMFQEWLPGESLRLRYNPDYFMGRPCLNGVIYRIIPDMATIFMEMTALGVDWIGLTAIQYQRQTDTKFFKENFNKYRYPSNAYSFIGWNMKDARFQDVRIRQAQSYALARREIIDGVLLGMGEEATGPLMPGTIWYNDKVARYTYDPEKSKQLFKQAGWEIAEDRRLRNAEGEPFDFVLITNQGNTYRQNAGIFIQYRLAQMGVKVELRVIEWTAFLKEFVDAGRFDAVLLGWTMPHDPSLYQVFHSDNIGAGKLNFTGYANKELDDLLKRELTAIDMQERKAIYDRVQEIIAADQPYAFLYIPMSMPAIHSRFQGIAPAVAGISYNFLKWYVPEGRQMRSFNALEP